jgi:SAM-dependent methyltransferase
MRDYDVTAEFYDVLHAADYLATTRRLLDRWLGTPKRAVIDVGAGTGLGTALLASRTDVPVHAIEPSRSMRAVMLSRLAEHGEMLSRVRVHTCGVQNLRLRPAADFALCLNIMATFDAYERASALSALAGAMVPAGRLVVQCPPTEAVASRNDLPSMRVGGETYGGYVTATPRNDTQIEWCFTYRVTRGDVLVRQETETFAGYAVCRGEFRAELRTAGFIPHDVDEPEICVATLR